MNFEHPPQGGSLRVKILDKSIKYHAEKHSGF